MDIIGKVIQVLPIQGGKSGNGKEWQSKTFILETLETYPRKVAVELFGEERINGNPCEAGQTVTASVDIESREFNGRWYTSVRAWKVTKGAAPTQANYKTANSNAANVPQAPADNASAPVAQEQTLYGDKKTELPF